MVRVLVVQVVVILVVLVVAVLGGGGTDRVDLKMNSSKFCCVFFVNTKSLLSLGW